MKARVLGAILLLFSLSASAATIHGSVYEYYSLEKLPNAIVSINSFPNQQVVAENGNYLFQVPRGNYTLQAKYVKDGQIVYAGDQNVSILSDGNFEYDILVYSVDGKIQPSASDAWKNYFFAAVLLAIIAGMGYRLYHQKPPPKVFDGQNLQTPKKFEIARLDEKAKTVLTKLRDCGGRLTQKELREKLPQYSEAMVSLIVAELESEGKVKKIKQGRGNIIVVKD